MPQRALGQNFQPYQIVVISASTSSANTSVTQPISGMKASDLCIDNPTTAICYVAWGTTTQTAFNTSFPVLAGSAAKIFTGLPPITNIAVLLSTGTGNITASIGVGT